MEDMGMTNEQSKEYKKLIVTLVLEVLDNSETTEEAKEKIKKLLDEE